MPAGVQTAPVLFDCQVVEGPTTMIGVLVKVPAVDPLDVMRYAVTELGIFEI